MKFLLQTVLIIVELLVFAATSDAQTWTWPGDIRDHMQDHGVTVDGKPVSQLRSEHDWIHNITQQGTPNPDDYKLLAQRSLESQQALAPERSSWTSGMAKIRVRTNQFTDSGSAVCVGFGRTEGEWTFLTCSHNLESGQTPELLIRGQWVAGTVLYRDRLAPVVNGARTHAGPDRAVVVVQVPENLKYSRVSASWSSGPVEVAGYPSTDKTTVIRGQGRITESGMIRAELQRPSQPGFSGGGVFNAESELVGIWSAHGYAESFGSFLDVFSKLGWKPGNWSHVPFPDQASVATREEVSRNRGCPPGGCPTYPTQRIYPRQRTIIAPRPPPVIVSPPRQIIPPPQQAPPPQNTSTTDALKTEIVNLKNRVAILESRPLPNDGNDGEDGEDGEDGTNGIGIFRLWIDGGNLLYERDNGEVVSAGALPINKSGIQNAWVVNNELWIERSDGSSEAIGTLNVTPGESAEVNSRLDNIEAEIKKPFRFQLFDTGVPVSKIREVNPHGGYLSLDLFGEVIKAKTSPQSQGD